MPADLEIVGKPRTPTSQQPGTPGGDGGYDSSGSSCHNRRLAERLANNVANALANMPVARDAEFLSQNRVDLVRSSGCPSVDDRPRLG
jgi:hypothetical protein